MIYSDHVFPSPSFSNFYCVVKADLKFIILLLNFMSVY